MLGFILQMTDPLNPVIGEISDAGQGAISMLDSIIYIGCMIAVLISGYRTFFGDAKDGIITFFIVLTMAGIVSGFTAAL